MSVPRWGYEWELTLPQIEIMQADLPHTLYLKDGAGEKKKNTQASDKVLRLQEEANRKAAERKRKQQTDSELTLDELFKK